MRTRKQEGQVIRIDDRWYVSYWERRNVGGTIEQKRVTHQLGPVTTRGKQPPADIKDEAERHTATINSGTFPADRVVTISDFVEGVYLPWVEMHKRPSTVKGYRDIWEDHLKPICEAVWLEDRRGLGSNLYRLGVPEMVIQRILRHANVSTTATYYIKTAADDVSSAMAKLESQITVGSVRAIGH